MQLLELLRGHKKSASLHELPPESRIQDLAQHWQAEHKNKKVQHILSKCNLSQQSLRDGSATLDSHFLQEALGTQRRFRPGKQLALPPEARKPNANSFSEDSAQLLQQITPSVSREKLVDKRYYRFPLYTTRKREHDPPSLMSDRKQQQPSQGSRAFLFDQTGEPEQKNKHQKIRIADELFEELIHDDPPNHRGAPARGAPPKPAKVSQGSDALLPPPQPERQKPSEESHQTLNTLTRFRSELKHNLSKLSSSRSVSGAGVSPNFLMDFESYSNLKYPKMADEDLRLSKDEEEKIFHFRKNLLVNYKYA